VPPALLVHPKGGSYFEAKTCAFNWSNGNHLFIAYVEKCLISFENMRSLGSEQTNILIENNKTISIYIRLLISLIVMQAHCTEVDTTGASSYKNYMHRSV
jgi:hypothetical protein